MRFVEVGNEVVMRTQSSNRVLGETFEVKLPNAELSGLEAPYNEIEKERVSKSCVEVDEAKELLSDYVKYLEKKDIDDEEFEEILSEIENVEENMCE